VIVGEMRKNNGSRVLPDTFSPGAVYSSDVHVLKLVLLLVRLHQQLVQLDR
jgi:hypothetical protein